MTPRISSAATALAFALPLAVAAVVGGAGAGCLPRCEAATAPAGAAFTFYADILVRELQVDAVDVAGRQVSVSFTDDDRSEPLRFGVVGDDVPALPRAGEQLGVEVGRVAGEEEDLPVYWVLRRADGTRFVEGGAVSRVDGDDLHFQGAGDALFAVGAALSEEPTCSGSDGADVFPASVDVHGDDGAAPATMVAGDSAVLEVQGTRMRAVVLDAARRACGPWMSRDDCLNIEDSARGYAYALAGE